MGVTPLILLVDDEPNFLEILSTKLNLAGYRVELAANGDLGVKKAKELHPDLIMMDVRMPVKNGIDAVVELRQDPLLKKTKVIFLTSYGDTRPGSDEIDAKFAREIGAADYIRKTDDLDVIVAHIDAVVRR